MKVASLTGELLAKSAVRASPGIRWTAGNPMSPMPDASYVDAMTLALHHGLCIAADGSFLSRVWSVSYMGTHNAWCALWWYEDHMGMERTHIHKGEGNSAAPRMHTSQRSTDLCAAICRCVVTNVLGYEVDD